MPGSAGLSPDDLMEKADRLPLEQADTKGFVIVASRSHLSPETEEYIRKLESEYGHVNLISCGSSLKICRVAEGSADIYPRFCPHDGMGYGSRTCHCTGFRKKYILDG